MNRLKELKEARDAAKKAIITIDNAISSLAHAQSWGVWDMLGGEFITSWVKRIKIKEANEDILKLNKSMKHLNKELEDINMLLPNRISQTFSDTVLDLWLDNIFTDIRVQGEIKQTLEKLRWLKKTIQNLIANIEFEIKEIETPK
ncbi:hypothetical protein [Vagococcus lutrae]|uniref:hypothetical protein n=1 Tax=Vagococcus lutrae TaxID=81947 RepID=UPI00200DC98F|nr:hypothetical protein [Vagococcus lutrae]MDT2805663.1 hypothetical protein [Vagococcus lutrae]UQF18952.1 hypothetical protein M2905_00515 [Vagococcus lutrae]